MKYLAIPSSIFSFFLIYRRALRSQTIRGKVRRIGRMFPGHAERSFLDPEYSFVAVRRITRTIFAKQKFAQLRTNYIRRILPTMFAKKCSPNEEPAIFAEYSQICSRTNVHPIKNQLYSPNTPNYIREQMFPLLKPTIFAEYSQLYSRTNVHPIKNQLYSPNTPNHVREQRFPLLKQLYSPNTLN